MNKRFVVNVVGVLTVISTMDGSDPAEETDRILMDRPAPFVYAEHAHEQPYEPFSADVGVAVVTTSGAVMVQSYRVPLDWFPNGLPPLTPTRPVVTLGVGGYVEKLRF